MKNELPPAALMISHTIANWEIWKDQFDAQDDARKAGGMLGHRINRGLDDENWISVYAAVGNMRAAEAFVEDPAMQAAMSDTNVTSKPELTWLSPVLESVVWRRTLPGMMISYTVADFNTWFTGYKIADEMLAANGIIGHAASHVLGDPNQIVLYQQAASHETLRAYMANPALKSSLASSGVTSVPKVVYTHGGWAKTY